MSELGPARIKFHVRCPARCRPEEHERRLHHALDRMLPRLERQGYQFVRLEPSPPRGPLPVVPIKGFPHRPPKPKRGQPETRPDDALWRVSTLPTFGPKAAHLVTDEVDWEYAALFIHPTIRTEVLADA